METGRVVRFYVQSAVTETLLPAAWVYSGCHFFLFKQGCGQCQSANMQLRWILCDDAVKLFSFLFLFFPIIIIYSSESNQPKWPVDHLQDLNESLVSSERRRVFWPSRGCPRMGGVGIRRCQRESRAQRIISRSKQGHVARLKAYLTALHLADVAINHQVGPASATGCLTNVPQ